MMEKTKMIETQAHVHLERSTHPGYVQVAVRAAEEAERGPAEVE
jgi:hypothetical protein